MATLKRSLILLGLLLLVAACGARLKRDLSKPKSTHLNDANLVLAGSFIDSDGLTVSLANNNSLPTVMVFSQQTCTVCIAEAQDFRNHLNDATQAPTQINLYTILVGDGPSVAASWKTQFSLPWVVGADENLDLFAEYCPDLLTPCTIVHTPSQGIVYRKTGPSHVSEIQRFTGPWN